MLYKVGKWRVRSVVSDISTIHHINIYIYIFRNQLVKKTGSNLEMSRWLCNRMKMKRFGSTPSPVLIFLDDFDDVTTGIAFILIYFLISSGGYATCATKILNNCGQLPPHQLLVINS